MSRILFISSLLILLGCDYTAQWSGPGREFTGLRTSGLVAPKGQCLASTEDVVMRFVPLSTDGAVNPEMRFLNVDAFGAQDIELTQVAAFSGPNQDCEDLTCAPGFVCAPASGFFEPSLQRCHNVDVSAQVGAPTFVSRLQSHQRFGVLMENAGSLSGDLPASLDGLFPDLDGDGVGDSYTWSREEAATDVARRRKSALGVMRSNWQRVAEYAAREFKTQTYFGLWTFGDTAPAPLLGAQEPWVVGPGAVRMAIDRYPNETKATRAHVYASMISLLRDRKAYGHPSMSTEDKVLVVFVDGPDEGREPLAGIYEVLAAAEGTRVFIIHLDNVTQGPRLDDPAYLAGQTPDACDCREHEECRAVTQYATQEGVPVTPRPGAFCVPKRDVNGRTGPIAEYAEIACETEGGYIYVPEPETLPNQIDWLPRVLDGLWEVPVTLSGAPEVMPGEALSWQMNVTVTIDGTGRPYSASQKGEFRNADTRFVTFPR